MSNTLSPNMGLVIPGIGTEAGPTYATDINNSLSTIDQHTHAAGSGVLITPAAINVNSALTLNNNFLINSAGMTLTPQGSAPSNITLYASGIDLYFVDGSGNNVRITQTGGIAGSPGSIANLTSPASAAYVSSSGTFVWQSNTNIAANLDAGAITLRNMTPNSTYGVTVQAAATLGANYALTLPSLPVSQSFLTIDTTGNISAYAPAAAGLTHANLSASAGITGGQLSSTAGIVGGQLANQTITATQIANNTITTSQIATAYQYVNIGAGSGLTGGGVTYLGGATTTVSLQMSGGQIGTFAMAFANIGTQVTYGSTTAGSNLTPCDVTGNNAGGTFGGTWQCLGYSSALGPPAQATLWQRIS